MKDKPTELDREAGRLFVPADGARAWTKYMRGRVLGADETGCRIEGECGGFEAIARVVALDTDDPATVGVMLAQVEAACGEPADVWTHSRHTGCEYEVDRYDGATLGSGPTRGAALVEAMRAIKAVRR